MTSKDLYGMSAGGSYLTIADNTFKHIFTTALILAENQETSATVSRNVFEDVGLGIQINGPANGSEVVATISGSPENANIFRNTITLVNNFSPNAFNAEYNDWGLCSLEAIEAKIVHNPDIPARGAVDFDPFIAPESCFSPTPTSTPSQPPGPTESPTPTSGAQRKQGDTDCDGDVDGLDGLLPGLLDAGVPIDTPDGCVELGAGNPMFGDVNCDESVDLSDTIAILQFVAGVAIDPPHSIDCTPLGELLPT
jgi:hypothetical protein